VEYEFLAIVQETPARNGFVVAYRDITLNVGITAHVLLLNGYRFDPVDYILQHEVLSKMIGDIPRDPRVIRLVANIQEE